MHIILHKFKGEVCEESNHLSAKGITNINVNLHHTNCLDAAMYTIYTLV